MIRAAIEPAIEREHGGPLAHASARAAASSRSAPRTAPIATTATVARNASAAAEHDREPAEQADRRFAEHHRAGGGKRAERQLEVDRGGGSPESLRDSLRVGEARGMVAADTNAEARGDVADPESSSIETTARIGAPGPEPLGTGVSSVTTGCWDDAWQSPSTGTAHALIRSCSITWSRDLSVSPTEYWQTMRFELNDNMTDGYCARATVFGVNYYECNGVWVWKNLSFSGHHSSITTTLSWGGNNPVSRTADAPNGY